MRWKKNGHKGERLTCEGDRHALLAITSMSVPKLRGTKFVTTLHNMKQSHQIEAESCKIVVSPQCNSRPAPLI